MKRSIQTRSFPNLLCRYPRDFTFHVAAPISSVRAVTTSESIREQAGSGTEPSSSTGIAA